MRNTLITILFVLAASSVFAQFRDTTWGISQAEVVEIEGEAFTVTGEDTYVRRVWYSERTFLDFSAEVFYAFEDDMLLSAGYLLPVDAGARIVRAIETRQGLRHSARTQAAFFIDNETSISVSIVNGKTLVTYTAERLLNDLFEKDMARQREQAEVDSAAF